MSFQDVAFLSSRAGFPTTFKKIAVEVNILTQPHILQLWLGVSKGILPVKYFHSVKLFFVSVEFNDDHKTVSMLR